MCAATTPQTPGSDAAGGLTRPQVSERDAEQIARECYGLTATATELGSNQDRNFLLIEPTGEKSVLRIDNPVFTDAERDGQHAALAAFRSAGVPVASVLPGLDGQLTQHWGGFAVRRSEYAAGEPMVHSGYFAPAVIENFGQLAGRSVAALAEVSHPGLDREHMWRMEVAHEETRRLAPAIACDKKRARVLGAADEAACCLASLAAELPTQVIHGDLTDDNVMGERSTDTRLHPRIVLDLGDMSRSWRVSELAITCASLLHHDPDRPFRVLDAVRAYHRVVPLTESEAHALWPLIVLRAAVLLASAHRQLEIDSSNDYARDRIAGEERIFAAATSVSVQEGTEQVLAALGIAPAPLPASLAGSADVVVHSAAPLSSLLPGVAAAAAAGYGEAVALADCGVTSPAHDAGAWLQPDAKSRLIRGHLREGARAVVLPYGVYRLWEARINSADAAATWPYETEIVLADGVPGDVTAPAPGTVQAAGGGELTLRLGEGWLLRLRGIEAGVQPLTAVAAGERLGEVRGRGLAVALLREEALAAEAHGAEPGCGCSTGGSAESACGCASTADESAHCGCSSSAGTPARLVTPSRVSAWERLSRDPAPLLHIRSLAQRDTAPAELTRRGKIFASAQERYYERPMQIERGWRQHLIDVTCTSYVDMVNNVAGLGHGHPGVAEAAARQIRVLNTNSRFLYASLAEYSEQLLALVPEGSDIDTVLLVNSGSEAVDLALRLAQAATGRKTVVALREAYHGWTMASDAVSTSAYDNPYALDSRPEWIHVADVPNSYRGTYRGPGTGDAYARDLGRDLTELAAAGKPVAGFICESVLGNAGGVTLPEGYLADVYERVRAAGGLCIADEVQVGFGRMGSSWWGFEQSGVLPDIIAIAKPMGNGFPIGGVLTSKRIADALATQGQFFASTGGNPLSCEVGLAVLRAMREEGLQENARVVGAHLRARLESLQGKHPLVGPVHGQGLYLGLELVRDHHTLEPAKEEAAAICERLRELGVVVLTTSERSNVLKIKPPLCLTRESADFVVDQLERVLTEGW